MRKVTFGVVCAAVIGLTSSAFAAECSRPSTAPSIPDGSAASRDEMIAANKAIKDYVAATNAFIACVDAEESAAAAKEAAQPKADNAKIAKIHAQYVPLHNAAVDDLQKIADQFNAAVRAFKAKSQK